MTTSMTHPDHFEVQTTMNGTCHEWGYDGTKRRLVLKRREEVDEEADNDFVDSLIDASSS